jgi:hypothetical protein
MRPVLAAALSGAQCACSRSIQIIQEKRRSPSSRAKSPTIHSPLHTNQVNFKRESIRVFFAIKSIVGFATKTVPRVDALQSLLVQQV